MVSRRVAVRPVEATDDIASLRMQAYPNELTIRISLRPASHPSNQIKVGLSHREIGNVKLTLYLAYLLRVLIFIYCVFVLPCVMFSTTLILLHCLV